MSVEDVLQSLSKECRSDWIETEGNVLMVLKEKKSTTHPICVRYIEFNRLRGRAVRMSTTSLPHDPEKP